MIETDDILRILLFIILIFTVLFICTHYSVVQNMWTRHGVYGGVFIPPLASYMGGARQCGRVKNIKLNPQSKFETRVRDIFGNIAKTAINIAESKDTIPEIKNKLKDKRYRFYTMYPDWLHWKGKELEIDGYNELLGLAFEVQGPQHSEFSENTDDNYASYYNRLCNDAAKRKLAKEYGVGFIEIDYKLPKYLLDDYIKSRIYDLCNDNASHPKLRCDLLEPMSTHPPTNYISAQSIIPFRDYKLEEKYGLKELDNI